MGITINPAGMTYERAFEIAVEVDAAVVRPQPQDPLGSEYAEWHATGMWDQDIAVEMEISIGMTRNIRQRLGLPSNQPGGRPVGKAKRPRQIGPDFDARVAKLNAAGFNDAAIAARLDAVTDTVRRHRQHMELPVRGRGRAYRKSKEE